jgi:hypothetical protein
MSPFGCHKGSVLTVEDDDRASVSMRGALVFPFEEVRDASDDERTHVKGASGPTDEFVRMGHCPPQRVRAL